MLQEGAWREGGPQERRLLGVDLDELGGELIGCNGRQVFVNDLTAPRGWAIEVNDNIAAALRVREEVFLVLEGARKRKRWATEKKEIGKSMPGERLNQT